MPQAFRPFKDIRQANVLHVFLELNVGGAQQLLLTTLRHADRSKFNYVICCLKSRGDLADEVEKLGVKVVCLNRLGKSNDLGAILSLINIIQLHNIDIVHTHLYSRSNFYGRGAAMIAGVPVIVATEHGPVGGSSWKKRLSDRMLWRYTDHIVAVCEAVRPPLLKRNRTTPPKVSVIYNGVDLDRFAIKRSKHQVRQDLHLEADAPVIGVIARLDAVKGHQYLLEAMPEILMSIPQAQLMFVGTGPLEQWLHQRIAQLALKSHVLFLGLRRDIPELLKAMDVFVLPSLCEGLALALLEAMACCLPVVASRVGGIPEVVEDGRTGVLVPPGDSDALAQAIIVLLKDEEKRHRMGMLGKERVLSQFTAQHSVAQLEALYESLLQAKGIKLPA
jgi:glycosyltransferase involved in cell wall biosynthesis